MKIQNGASEQGWGKFASWWRSCVDRERRRPSPSPRYFFLRHRLWGVAVLYSRASVNIDFFSPLVFVSGGMCGRGWGNECLVTVQSQRRVYFLISLSLSDHIYLSEAADVNAQIPGGGGMCSFSGFCASLHCFILTFARGDGSLVC